MAGIARNIAPGIPHTEDGLRRAIGETIRQLGGLVSRNLERKKQAQSLMAIKYKN